jgi:hypothetical protein
MPHHIGRMGRFAKPRRREIPHRPAWARNVAARVRP